MAVHSHIDGGYTIISMHGWQTTISMAAHNHIHNYIHNHIDGRYTTISMAGTLLYPLRVQYHINGRQTSAFLKMHIVLKVGHSSNDLLRSILRYLLT